MLKLIRQYNQWILVVGGTLLLITFLMPSAIQSCAQQSAVSGSVWATYGSGEKVTGADLEQAQLELRVIEMLRNPTLMALGADRAPEHWWLLVHEATQAGLVGGVSDAEALLMQAAQAGGPPAEQFLFNMAKQSGTNRDVVLSAVAKMQGVTRLTSLAAGVDRVSDRRLEQSVAKSLLGVSGDVVVIDARANTSIEVPAPSEASLAEHLAKFGDKPAPPSNLLGMDNFGYRLPDRAKLEWFVISKASIAATIANSPELETIALKKRFAQDPAKFGADPAFNPSFAISEPTVRARTTDELVQRRVDEIAKFASDQLSLAQRSLKRQGAYFVLGDDWASRKPSFEELAQTISREFGIELPTYQSTGDLWLTAEEIENLPTIGRATTDKFGAPVRASQLVAGMKELSAANINAPFQRDIASPPMVADTGDICFVRAIDAAASRAPTGVDEVRDALVRDLMAIERYQWLAAREADIAAEAATAGIRSVAERFGVVVTFGRDMREADPRFIGFGARITQPIPGLSGEGVALSSLVARASKLPLTADLATVPITERTVAIASPARLSLAVVQIAELSPVSLEEFQRLASTSPELVNITRDQSLVIDARDLFSLESLSKRYDFKLSRATDDMPTRGAPIAPIDPL